MNNEINYVSPFKKFVITIGNLPTAYLESMSYYEAITFLVNYLSNNVIPALNNNGLVVEELQAKFTELKDYVDHYFDNLDVQEEINNKLDDMADSGQLTDIIAQYLGLAGVLAFNTVADMKLANNLVNGSIAKTLGFHSLNDGGGSSYKIRTITNEDIVNEMDIIALSDNTLIAELIYEYPINPKKLGAYGDGTHDDYNPIQNAINKCNVLLSNGNYYISQSINIPSNRIFDGGNAYLIPEEGIYALSIIGNGINNAKVEIYIKNVLINTTLNGGYGLYIKDSYFVYVDNINIIRLQGDNAIGINVINGFNHCITNSRVYGDLNYSNQIGLNIESTSTNDPIENMTNCKYDTLLLQNTQYGVKANYLTTANTIEFNNLGFSSCNYAYHLSGYGLPIKIKNSRIEVGSASWDTYGIYQTGNIHSSIDTLNVYNIKYPIYNDSEIELNLTGELCFTGTNQTTKYNCVTSNGNVMINTKSYFLSSTYNFMSSQSIAENKFIANGSGFINNGNVINSDNTSIPAPGNQIFKLTNRVFNLYGVRGIEIMVYAEESGYVLQSSTNGSPTSAFTGSNITVEPYKFYHIKFVDNNKWTVIN